MQLIKNVFLTREKTVSRKLEEILLVYILENNRIASKERMLEVYFNIIEWGPIFTV
jgi:membrane peptidoglycan carboxypeptidase